MLGVALGAILIACLLMVLILSRYEFKVNSKLAAGDREVQHLKIADQPAGITAPLISA